MATIAGTRGGFSDKAATALAVSVVTLGTAYSALGDADGYRVEFNSRGSLVLTWTTGDGTTLTIRALVSHNGTTWAVPPSLGAPSSGVSTAWQAEVVYPAAEWASGGTAVIALDVQVPGYPFVRFEAKADAASGASLSGTFVTGMA